MNDKMDLMSSKWWHKLGDTVSGASEGLFYFFSLMLENIDINRLYHIDVLGLFY